MRALWTPDGPLQQPREASPWPILLFAFALAWAVGGCESPSGPSRVPTPPTVDAALSPAWTLLREQVSPWPMATWLDRLPIRIVKVEVVDEAYTAYYRSGRMSVHPNALAMPLQELAAVLGHEARHADGYVHTCGTTKDGRIEQAGAWAVHVQLLEAMGRVESAAFLRHEAFCASSGRAWPFGDQHAQPRARW